MRWEARVCSGCGFAPLPEATFCSQCGRRLHGGIGGNDDPPHVYGVLTPGPALFLGCVLLLAGILALVVGSAIAAIVLLAFAGVAVVFFYDAARRNPASAVARRALTSSDHMRAWALFIRESSSAWVTAIRKLVRLRGESRSLRREREQILPLLGDAAYREDADAISALRLQLRQIDEGLEKRDRERAATLAAARRHVEEEHAAARPTQQFAADDLTSEGGAEK